MRVTTVNIATEWKILTFDTYIHTYIHIYIGEVIVILSFPNTFLVSLILSLDLHI